MSGVQACAIFFPCDPFAESKWQSCSNNEPCCSDGMVYNANVKHLLFGSMKDSKMTLHFLTVRFSSMEMQKKKFPWIRKKKKKRKNKPTGHPPGICPWWSAPGYSASLHFPSLKWMLPGVDNLTQKRRYVEQRQPHSVLQTISSPSQLLPPTV